MLIPDEFDQFCRHFNQDVTLIHDRPDDAIDSALRSMDAKQKSVLRAFLDKVFASLSPLQEAKRAWRRSPAEIGFKRSSDLLALLTSVRQKLESGSTSR